MFTDKRRSVCFTGRCRANSLARDNSPGATASPGHSQAETGPMSHRAIQASDSILKQQYVKYDYSRKYDFKSLFFTDKERKL